MEEHDAARHAELIAQEMRDNAAQAAEHAQTLAAENTWEWEAAEPDPDSGAQDVMTALLARIEALERDVASLETALSEHQHDRDKQAVWPV